MEEINQEVLFTKEDLTLLYDASASIHVNQVYGEKSIRRPFFDSVGKTGYLGCRLGAQFSGNEKTQYGLYHLNH